MGWLRSKPTEIRRRLSEVEADQAALRGRRTELEKFLIAAPAPTWREAAEKARYLIGLFATTSMGRDPRRQKLIAGVLDDFSRLSGEPAATPAAGEADAGRRGLRRERALKERGRQRSGPKLRLQGHCGRRRRAPARPGGARRAR